MDKSYVLLKAYAKVNLSLDILGTREDGYHLMDMVNRSVNLFDTLRFERTPGRDFSISSNLSFLPTGEKNLVWKAAQRMALQREEAMPQVHCRLMKRIPSQAGLGGGSADAAATLLGLNYLCGYGFSRNELLEMAQEVGADVPFCLAGGAARVGGIGEEITSFADPGRYVMVLAMPRGGNSTKEIFSKWDSEGGDHPQTEKVVQLLSEGRPEEAFAFACNVLQPFGCNEAMEGLMKKMQEFGAYHVAMTGTGAAVFGIFRQSKEASRCCAAIRRKQINAWVVTPSYYGVEMMI